MNRTKKWKNLLIAGIVFALFVSSTVTAWAVPASGTSAGDSIVVRQSPVDGAQVGSLSYGQAVSISDETTGSDAKTWYYVTYTVDATTVSGWVRGDLLNTSDEPLVEDEESDDIDEAAEEAGVSAISVEEEVAVSETTGSPLYSRYFSLSTGQVTLIDIPDEQQALAMETGRFVQTIYEFSEGELTALVLALPYDDLVTTDTSRIGDFYYVYGYDEDGEIGWYVLDEGNGTLQKCLTNMAYSPLDVAAASLDTNSSIMLCTLAVACLLLLILAIIFSVRYHRIRKILRRQEESVDEEEEEERRAPVSTAKRRPTALEQELMDLAKTEAVRVSAAQELSASKTPAATEESSAAQESVTAQGFVAAQDVAATQEFTAVQEAITAQKSSFAYEDSEASKAMTANGSSSEQEPFFYDDDDDDLEFL